MSKKSSTKQAQDAVRRNVMKMESQARSIEGMQGVADVVEASFEGILEQMRSYYRPHDYLEEVLVRRIARCTWRLQVLETIEEYRLTAVRLNSDPGDYLKELSVIERRTDVMLHRAIQALAAKRKQDRENMKNKLNELPPPGKWPRPEPGMEECEAQNSPGSPRQRPEQQSVKATHPIITQTGVSKPPSQAVETPYQQHT